MAWDLFISYAHEDRSVADPLATRFRARGLEVWYDRFELRLGDGLRRKVDEGLALSAHGLVILSPRFFAKKWPRRELDGLVARSDDRRRILPVWHDLGHAEVAAFSPTLADLVGISTAEGLGRVEVEVLRAIRPELSGDDTPPPRPARPLAREALRILREAARGDGTIHTLAADDGVHLNAGSRVLDDPADPRAGARCLNHLRRLVALGYLAQVGEAAYEVTHEGYAHVGRLD